eukprot:CAMPEP_0204304148 /NCGR_PEP_ID=MMETSP0468-20130131/84264_1 /ASSEMBLY_ACC=CAM_ASM_000383 /TAXON_ID=2969 /ORGANISM="Oxyrrhis marina" /LENGTH=101 /DNA_ID=CAMNT_0051283471 /DNA_START=356 /DNA_END=661 /DNA_ORIENTATION=+
MREVLPEFKVSHSEACAGEQGNIRGCSSAPPAEGRFDDVRELLPEFKVSHSEACAGEQGNIRGCSSAPPAEGRFDDVRELLPEFKVSAPARRRRQKVGATT